MCQMQEQFRQQRVRELTDAHFSCRNDTTPVQIVVMTKIIFSDYRSPAAEQAYETFWFAAELSAMISRRCIPGAAYHHDGRGRLYQPDSDGQSRDFRTPALPRETRRSAEGPTYSSAWRHRKAVALIHTLLSAMPVIPDADC
jgi:hypothetical protein